ncbi:Sodium/potassium-transporting ATPase subunit alpha [Araneus ventricosus]|uniref:Sodium/potassium-transporting ATPase subunit alpha n=1 Tax=Araneus ventricosus TaxID=182803 RepID=A0A4Y2D6H5_ARAVE|nr:Sodium/potassium-transporting ATPase subunit alpha [Araneus ventricosus]
MATVQQKARLWFHEIKSFATVQRCFRLEYRNCQSPIISRTNRLFPTPVRSSNILKPRIADAGSDVAEQTLDNRLVLGAVGAKTVTVFPAICIGFEKEEDNIMLREPKRRKDDRLFSLRMMFVSYLQYGIWQTMVAYLNNFLIIAEDGFPPSMVFGIKRAWDSKAINDLPDQYNQEWTYYHRKRLEDLGQTAFFNTVVIMQLFNAVMCKTLKNSIFQQGMGNWYLNCSLVFSLLIAVTVVYTPYFNRFFRMVPLPVKLWFVPVPFALWLFAIEEVRKWYMRRLGPGSWLEQISVT